MAGPLILAPFGLLLAAMALGPLFFPAWWARHYPKVASALALIVVASYCFGLHESARVWETTCQYISFIVLVGALFVVSGGIHITVKGEGSPLANVLFLLVGAITANLLGAIGASMLLIRPWLRLNHHRVAAHHVVFFIFIVSNVGGCLTPLGPPLFLGYMLGVPFWWTTWRCLPAWSVAVGMLLLMFYMIDRKNYRLAVGTPRGAAPSARWRCDGLSNLVFLAVILAAMTVNHPLFLRETLMIGAALGSWFTTKKAVHHSNHFHMEPFQEVAILFLGIFATMMPALDWLQANASRLPAAAPGFYYFSAGTLSSILDNAPTYLCFLKAIFGRFLPHAAVAQSDPAQVAQVIADPKLAIYLVAVSVGSVFFGGCTYIGNAPNFMVKSIADHQKVPTPTFLAYIWKFTIPFMVPTLLVVWLLFFRAKP